MKLDTVFEAILIGAQIESFAGKDGKDIKICHVSIEQNDGVGMIPCLGSLAEKIVSGEYPKYSACKFYAQYDTEKENDKKSYRVVGIA